MRASILLFTVFLAARLFSQAKINIDTTDITEFDHSVIPYFNHFYIEYLDFKLEKVTKEKAQLKRYTFYHKNKKCFIYPVENISKKSKVFLSGKKIAKSNPLILMNGLFSLQDRKGLVYEKILYDNGFIVKHILKSASFWHPNDKGKIVSEIAEYDYSTFPFVLHYIRFKRNGEIKINYYLRYNNGTWTQEPSDKLMSADL